MITTPKTRSRRRCAAAAIIRGQHVGRDTLANRRHVAADGVRLHSNNQCNFSGHWVAPTIGRAAKRLGVQAGQRRCSGDPAVPFDRVASSRRSWPRISSLQFSYLLAEGAQCLRRPTLYAAATSASAWPLLQMCEMKNPFCDLAFAIRTNVSPDISVRVALARSDACFLASQVPASRPERIVRRMTMGAFVVRNKGRFDAYRSRGDARMSWSGV